MTQLYIFDLDGTLALNDHRKHILYDKSNQNRWDDFYRACVYDKPNEPILKILDTLIIKEAYQGNKADIIIFSGRSDLVFKETIKWINDNSYLYADATKPYTECGNY